MSKWRRWWPAGSATPPPGTWSYVVEDLTLGDRGIEWAMAAAHFVASHYSASGQGPFVREVFEHLLPETNGSPGPTPVELTDRDRKKHEGLFQMYVLLHWHRHSGLLRWQQGVARSLTVTRRFHEECRLRTQLRSKDHVPTPRSRRVRPTRRS